MMWHYKGKEVTQDNIPQDAIGFVYIIGRIATDEQQSKIYIGKKLLHSTTKKKIGKRAQARQALEVVDKRRIKKVQRITKQSDWMDYNSSCVQLKKEIAETPELFVKEILHWCWNKKQMSYLETKEQMLHNCLENPELTYNDHVQNWWRRDIIKQEN